MNNQRVVIILGIAAGLILLYALPVRYAVLVGVLCLVVAYLFNKVSNKAAAWIAISLAAALMISWGHESLKKSEVENTKIAATRPLQWYMYWEKPEGFRGDNLHERSKELPVNVRFVGNSVIIERLGYRNQVDLVKLDRENSTSRTFRGNWSQKDTRSSGKIVLTFSHDLKSASGFQTKNGEKGEILTQIYQK